MPDSGHLALPFVVGITGHRQLADPDHLAQELKRHFTEVADRIPACRPVLLSALAAGADQIAARVALDLGWELIAVLPFAPEDPRHGFSAGERAEFHRLLAAASHWVDASAQSGLAGLAATGPETVAPDEDHFLAAGRHIANAAHVLVSAWDGVDSPAVGGTADITRYRLNLRPLRIEPLTLAPLLEEWKQVLVLPTRRAAGGDSCCAAGVSRSLPAGWYRDWDALRRGIPDCQRTREAMHPYESLNAPSAKLGASGPAVRGSGENLAGLFDAADGFSSAGATWLRKHWYWMFVLTLIALVSGGVYGDLKDYLPLPAAFLALYLFCLTALWIWVKQVRRKAEKRQPWDWRLFAEILRILQVWRTAGHAETEPSLAPTLGARAHVPAWVIHAYRGVSMMPCASEEATGGRPSGLNKVRQGWVREQIVYFDAVIGAARRRRNLRRVSTASLPISAVLAATCLVLELYGQEGLLLTLAWFAASLLPGLGAAGLVLSELREKAGASDAVHHQRQRLIALREMLGGECDPAEACARIAEAGRLAIVEVCVFHEAATATLSKSEAFLG